MSEETWKDERPWPNGRVIESFINAPMVDQQNEFITADAWPEVMPWFVKHGMMTWYHSDLIIGEPIAWRMRDNRPETKFGIYDSADSHIPYHDEVWRIIQKYGTKGATSIRGLPLSKERVCIADRCFMKIRDMGLWAVGWVGATPANIGATINYVAKAEGPEGAWLMAAMNSPDYDVRHLTAQIVQVGLAKVGSNVEAMAQEIIAADKKIGLEITDKAIAAMAKGVLVTDLILKCPKCREYLAKLEAAGVDANVAVADINARLQQAVSKPFAGYKDFKACVADNDDKSDPEGYCATIMRAVEGKRAGQQYGGFEAPEPSPHYSEHQRIVLAHAYASCRSTQGESEDPADKEKCAKIAHAAAQNAKSMTILFPAWNEDSIKKDGRPPADWWDACMQRAQSFATESPEQFCGWLWANGPPAQREAMGKENGPAEKAVVSLENLPNDLRDCVNASGMDPLSALVDCLKDHGYLKSTSQVVAHGTATIDKGVNPMADEPKDKPKDTTTQAAPTDAAKAADAKKEDAEAVIKTLIARVEALEGKAKGGEDFMKSHEDLKKSLDEFAKKIADMSERVLAIEGKIGVPAVSKRGEPKAPADTGGKPDFKKMSVHDMLAQVAKR